MADITKTVKEKIKELENSSIWIWIGLIGSVLSSIIALRNINKYMKELKEKGGIK